MTTPTIDVRCLPPRERHPLIFSTFGQLEPGQAMELVNDHDPRPLFHHFQAQVPGAFAWHPLEAGPAVWRVRITRLETATPAADTCGGCRCGH